MRLKSLFISIATAGLLISAPAIGAVISSNTNSAQPSVNEMSALRNVDRLFHQPADPAAGNLYGKVTMVEFFDYQCPHCVDMADILEQVMAKNPSVRVVFKELPFRGPVSAFAARVALAAKKQGKYTEFHQALMHYAKKQPLSEEVILELAGKTGLNVEQLKTDMTDAAIAQEIDDNLKLAQDLRVEGTPAFFIGKTVKPERVFFMLGVIDQAQFDSLIEKLS